MTIDQLRKRITVKTWLIDTDGIDIHYTLSGGKSKYEERSLYLPQNRSAQFLSAVGEIVISTERPLRVIDNEKEYLWEEFALRYKLCQWEALRIAIAYEYEKSVELDIQSLELDEALKALQ